MRYVRFSAFLVSLAIAALSGCGGGGSASGGSGGSGGGGGTTFHPRPFPGDFFAASPEPEFISGKIPEYPANVVYDAALKEFFFSNNSLNEVEAFSSVDGHRVGAVTVPGAMGLSLSPDGTRMAVGTSTPHNYFVDPATLHVTGEAEIPASVMDPATGYEPTMPFLMAAGPVLIEAGGNLFSYDPSNGVFALANPPGVANGSGIGEGKPARSLDGNFLTVPTLGPSGMQMAVYSAQSQTWIGFGPTQFQIDALAANPDGSQFAMMSSPSPGSLRFISFWNRSLQQQGDYLTPGTINNYSIV